MNKKLIIGGALLCMTLTAMTGCKKRGNEDVYENGRLVLNLRNLYFSSWTGDDSYTEEIQKKFKVKIKPSSYDYSSWGEQVSSAVNANNLPDVFHFDLENFNFGNTYKTWAKGRILKALPDDLSKWPKVQALINNTSNIDKLKLDGKLYGLPLAYNQNDPEKNYSSFTYVYRRDWVKQIDAKHKDKDGVYEKGYPLLRENDVYTWDEFLNILRQFKAEIPAIQSGDAAAIADVSWGFPSLTNFYKDSPHCYTYRNNKVVNAFATDEYINGLNTTRTLINENLYFDQVSNTNNTKAYDQYKTGNVGVYYENLSLTNYSTLRKNYKDIHSSISNEELNDATAIMKIKGPDGKFHLEGSENWFSMTMFNYDISDNKMEKVLDILDYLLGDEGTMLAIYGKEGYDYELNDGEVELIEENWVKKADGQYAPRENGAKYLREMITLNNDTTSIDPYTDQVSYQILNAWHEEMKAAKANGDLVVFAEEANLKWLSTNLKDVNTSALIKEGNDNAMKYCYVANGYKTVDEYKSKYNISKWTDTIAEINKALGK